MSKLTLTVLLLACFSSASAKQVANYKAFSDECVTPTTADWYVDEKLVSKASTYLTVEDVEMHTIKVVTKTSTTVLHGSGIGRGNIFRCINTTTQNWGN